MIAGLSLSLSLSRVSLQTQEYRGNEEGSIYTSFWLLSNELRVTRPHFSVIYAIISPYIRKSMKWVLVSFFNLTFFFIN